LTLALKSMPIGELKFNATGAKGGTSLELGKSLAKIWYYEAVFLTFFGCAFAQTYAVYCAVVYGVIRLRTRHSVCIETAYHVELHVTEMPRHSKKSRTFHGLKLSLRPRLPRPSSTSVFPMVSVSSNLFALGAQ
jgi:hypothetical protein